MKRMSVYMMPNPRKYYFLHPVQYFRDRTMCRRLALERGWLGFCESDVVEFSEWFCSVIPQILRTMMATPELRPEGIKRFDTPEKWQTWLNRVANGIEQGSASYAASDPRNEYRERYEEAYSKALARSGGEEPEFNQPEKIIQSRYLEREKELSTERFDTFRKSVNELLRNWSAFSAGGNANDKPPHDA